jgi:hypothetical protein
MMETSRRVGDSPRRRNAADFRPQRRADQPSRKMPQPKYRKTDKAENTATQDWGTPTKEATVGKGPNYGP